MRRAFILAAALSVAGCSPSGASEYRGPEILPPSYMSADGKSHFRNRVRQIQASTQRGGVLFAGDSLTEGCDWERLLPRNQTYNHGVGWDTSDGLKARLGLIEAAKPDVVFLTIGTNDIGYGHSPVHIAENITDVARSLSRSTPQTQLFVGAIPPQSDRKNSAAIRSVNQTVARAVAAMQQPFVQFYDLTLMFSGRNGVLKPALTYDGIHLNEAGCAVWAQSLPK